jgi:hypothetical protein
MVVYSGRSLLLIMLYGKMDGAELQKVFGKGIKRDK